jgi:rhamnosyltransferase
MDKCICAVIVTYQPEFAVLQELLQRIRQQVSTVVVVDNTSWPSPDTMLSVIGESAYIPMDGNKGVACAFNTGIDWARGRGCSHVLLMDQDSLPYGKMIDILSAGEDRLLEQGLKVAAVVPPK